MAASRTFVLPFRTIGEFRAFKAEHEGFAARMSLREVKAMTPAAQKALFAGIALDEPAKPAADAPKARKARKVCAAEGCKARFTPKSVKHRFCPEHSAEVHERIQARIDAAREGKEAEDAPKARRTRPVTPPAPATEDAPKAAPRKARKTRPVTPPAATSAPVDAEAIGRIVAEAVAKALAEALG